MNNSPKKILIVEDEPALLKILAESFAAEGFDVATARNGEEGLKQLQNKTPDIMLIDIIMPKMSGLKMLKKIREDEKNQEIPAVILSNLSDTASTAEALENKAYDYLVKTDWSVEELVKKIKEKMQMVT